MPTHPKPNFSGIARPRPPVSDSDAAIQKIRRDAREALILHKRAEGATIKEIADLIGVSSAHAGQLVRRAQRRQEVTKSNHDGAIEEAWNTLVHVEKDMVRSGSHTYPDGTTTDLLRDVRQALHRLHDQFAFLPRIRSL